MSAKTKGIGMQSEAMALMRRRIVISSTIGNALEWFDFTVFGLFAGIPLGVHFAAGNFTASARVGISRPCPSGTRRPVPALPAP